MPERYTSEKKTIGNLLSTTSPRIAVPEWQRNYSWDMNRVETFWQDVLAFSDKYSGDNINEQEYFLGSIVIVNQGIVHSLLDGQQRLATATILLSVIRDYLAEYKADAASRTQQKYVADLDDATNASAFMLTLNRYDRDFFRREIQEIRTPEYEPPEPSLMSHWLIRRAREFFQQKFEEAYNRLGRGKNAFDWALRVRLVLTDHVSVVAVTSTDEDNAADVFETLNDRGIGLSTPDLLRSLILRRANTDTDREEIIECWRTVLEIEDDAKVDDFLRHYWLSHKGDVKTRSLYREIKQTLLQENTDSLSFSRDLQQAANIYRDIVAARDDDPDIQRLLKNISLLGAKALMPAILSAYASGDVDQKRRFLSGLITMYVRHSVIGGLENSKLETKVYSIAKELRQNRNFDTAIDSLRQFAPSDNEFVERFKTASITRRDSARYILRELEHVKRSTHELEVELPDRVHVEHIYPQTPLPDQKWSNHNSAIDRVGNLTLLSRRINESIRNSVFTSKKPFYQQSDIQLTRELVEYDDWNMNTINDRQEKLSALVLSTWNF